MKQFSPIINAQPHYCTWLGRNVILKTCRDELGLSSLECLNREDCGFNTTGCRNRLIQMKAPKVQTKES